MERSARPAGDLLAEAQPAWADRRGEGGDHQVGRRHGCARSTGVRTTISCHVRYPVLPLPTVTRTCPECQACPKTAREREGVVPQWTLFENDFRAIDRVLSELLERTNALSVHLVDRSGQLITTAGRSDDFDATSFASLVPGDFTATAEISTLPGEATAQAVVPDGRARSVPS